jgi:hypothetical protein
MGDEGPKRVLELLGEIKGMLRDRAIELRRLPAAKAFKIQHSLEVISYQNGYVLEGYLDVIFADGEGVAWLFDVGWDRNTWGVESSLDRVSSGKSETVEHCVETPGDFDEPVRSLRRIVPELLAMNIPESEGNPWSGWPGSAMG